MFGDAFTEFDRGAEKTSPGLYGKDGKPQVGSG